MPATWPDGWYLTALMISPSDGGLSMTFHTALASIEQHVGCVFALGFLCVLDYNTKVGHDARKFVCVHIIPLCIVIVIGL